jgi:hypothetical protein
LRSCFRQDTTHKLNVAVVEEEVAVEAAAPWEPEEALVQVAPLALFAVALWLDHTVGAALVPALLER